MRSFVLTFAIVVGAAYVDPDGSAGSCIPGESPEAGGCFAEEDLAAKQGSSVLQLLATKSIASVDLSKLGAGASLAEEADDGELGLEEEDDEDAERALDDKTGRWMKQLPPCDKIMTKIPKIIKLLEASTKKLQTRLAEVCPKKRKPERCAEKTQEKLENIGKMLTYVKSCSTYGAFVQEAVSEDVDLDEASELDLMAEGDEEDEDEEEEDLSEDKPERKPKKLRPCDKIKNLTKKTQQVRARVDKFMKKLEKCPDSRKPEKCEKKMQERLARIRKVLDHLTSCGGAYGSSVEAAVSE